MHRDSISPRGLGESVEGSAPTRGRGGLSAETDFTSPWGVCGDDPSARRGRLSEGP